MLSLYFLFSRGYKVHHQYCPCPAQTYNRSGQVISERVNGQEILSDYDASGYRAQVDGLLAPLQQQWQSG
ncbi:hypothetical protein, partial [Lonsdalea iberica]|uniref:hypothetical protein n=1 Tax=Lonsdalea iberica TaxID=1082703 RepID=UPI001C37EC16